MTPSKNMAPPSDNMGAQNTVNQVVSFSGGKDSTAMLLEMLERGEQIHSVIAFDTGWEFPQMLDHWAKVEDYTGIKIVRLKTKKSFDFYLTSQPIISRKTKQIARTGRGWPVATRRWCTREKVSQIDKYVKKVPHAVSCIGFAADEQHRTFGVSLTKKKAPSRFPLIEWGIDEAEALHICKRHGFDWAGLYNHFNRVSCYCCPLQRYSELRALRKEFPDLWQKMLDLDSRDPNDSYFRGWNTLRDIERRFADEDKQITIFDYLEVAQ